MIPLEWFKCYFLSRSVCVCECYFADKFPMKSGSPECPCVAEPGLSRQLVDHRRSAKPAWIKPPDKELDDRCGVLVILIVCLIDQHLFQFEIWTSNCLRIIGLLCIPLTQPNSLSSFYRPFFVHWPSLFNLARLSSNGITHRRSPKWQVS